MNDVNDDRDPNARPATTPPLSDEERRVLERARKSQPKTVGCASTPLSIYW